MYKRLLLICFICFGLNFILFSQDSILFYGPYGGDMRVRPSFGVIPDYRYNNLVKISSLKSKNIAIAVVFPQIITVSNKNIGRMKINDYPYKFNASDFIKTLIFCSNAQNEYHFKLFEDADVVKLGVKQSIWDGASIITNKKQLSEINAKYDSDYLILIKGIPNGYFRSGKTGVLGLEGYSDIYTIYASHNISVFNLRTGKLLPKGYSIQVSADIIPVKLKSKFNDFSVEELKLVDKMMELRLRNNLHQTFKLLGLE